MATTLNPCARRCRRYPCRHVMAIEKSKNRHRVPSKLLRRTLARARYTCIDIQKSKPIHIIISIISICKYICKYIYSIYVAPCHFLPSVTQNLRCMVLQPQWSVQKQGISPIYGRENHEKPGVWGAPCFVSKISQLVKPQFFPARRRLVQTPAVFLGSKSWGNFVGSQYKDLN